MDHWVSFLAAKADSTMVHRWIWWKNSESTKHNTSNRWDLDVFTPEHETGTRRWAKANLDLDRRDL